MLKKLAMLAVAATMAATMAWAQGGPTAAQVGGEAEKAVDTRVGTQKIHDAWADEQARLLDQAEALGRELELTTRQRQKSEAYLTGQKAKVAEMEQRLRDIERIRAELEPYLDQTMERLGAFVRGDLPFLASERQERLKELRAKLDDFDASPAQKASRLLETLLIETQYGATVEAKETELTLDGSAREVRLLRLGRLGLFALGLEGQTAWRFDRQSGQWQNRDDYARELNRAADMAARTRVVSLEELPVGPPLAPAKEARP